MIEQEKREKAIVEMTKVASPYCLGRCKNCGWSKACGANIVSIKLYDAGYRKADKDSVFHIDISEELTKDFFQNEIEDARKKAIKEFVETVKRCLPNEPYLHAHIREIASIKFGVEVE